MDVKKWLAFADPWRLCYVLGGPNTVLLQLNNATAAAAQVMQYCAFHEPLDAANIIRNLRHQMQLWRCTI